MIADHPVDEGRGLRVATFNVRAAIGPGPFPKRWWRRCDVGRLERIAAVIDDLRADDVVALQEVALLALDGDIVDQAAVLARMSGMAHRYGAVRTWVAEEGGRVTGAGLFGNALLARGPLADPALLALPRAPDDALVEPAGSRREGSGLTYRDVRATIRESRCAILATVATDVGPLRVASAHFSHVGSGERGLQARALAASDAELVLADMNAAVDDPELEPFAGWTDAFAAAGIGRGDVRRRSTDDGFAIDQVLLSGAWRVESCEVVIAAGDASDHYPVVATLRR